MKILCIDKRHSRGFTLVEVLVVLFILGSLSLLATFSIDGLNEQSRFDDTKTRLQQIKKAIIGDVGRTLNGEAEISGYVADMGRLPLDIQELVVQDGQADWGLSAVTASDISPAVTISLGAGWRGPYIDTLPESDGARRFRDGWGNGDLSDVNFGWQYSANDISGVSVQSFGADGLSGVSTDPIFDVDYPDTNVKLIESADYTVSLNGITVQMNKPIAAGLADDLVLRVYYVDDGVISSATSDNEIAAEDAIGQQTLTFTFSGVAYFGRYAAVLLCNTAPTLVVFDGNCDAIVDVNHTPYSFNLIPRAQLPVIPWNIQ